MEFIRGRHGTPVFQVKLGRQKGGAAGSRPAELVSGTFLTLSKGPWGVGVALHFGDLKAISLSSLSVVPEVLKMIPVSTCSTWSIDRKVISGKPASFLGMIKHCDDDFSWDLP